MAQLGRFEKHVLDTSGNAVSGATVTIYREGATFQSGSGTSPTAFTVRDIGKIVAGDTVFINTVTGTTYTVDSVTDTTITLSGFGGTLSPTALDRFVANNNRPAIYADDQGGTTAITDSKLTSSATGLTEAWSAVSSVDYIVSGTGVTTTLIQGHVLGREFEVRGIVNVLDFGAVADGTTDDYTAIQQAIDTVGQDEVLLIPGGRTYGIGTKLKIGTPMTVLADGATLKALAGLTGAMLKFHYDLTAGEQRVQDTKQTGYYRGLILDGNDIANGIEFSRVYRALFEQIFCMNMKGTVWYFDRFNEDTMINCTIINCIEDGTEPLVDFTWEDPDNATGGDNTNSSVWYGCSFEGNEHDVYLKYDTSTNGDSQALRNNAFDRCLFHHIGASHISEDPTRWAGLPTTTLDMIHIGECRSTTFRDCEFQTGVNSGDCISLGQAGPRTASNVLFLGGRIDETHATNTPGDAFDVNSADTNSGHFGMIIDSDFTITDPTPSMRFRTVGFMEIDHTNFYDSTAANVALRLTNAGATSITSARSPIIQWKNENSAILNVMLQETSGSPTAIWEVTDAVSGTRTMFLEANAGESWLSVPGFVRPATTATITASTNQAQNQGPLTAEINEISVCANANDAVTLPVALAGRRCTIINNGAQTLRVWPATGDDAGAGANTVITLAAGDMIRMEAYDGTNWRVLPVLRTQHNGKHNATRR